MKDIYTAFGDYKGIIWTIEYQKCGLSHIHCLLFLSAENDYTNRDLIDRTVWAELPDEILDPNATLSELVKTHMIYGLCGHIDPQCVYMKDKNVGRGRKGKADYPKQFQEETSVQEDGYLLYF